MAEERPSGPPSFSIRNYVLDEGSRREGGFGYVFKAKEEFPPDGPTFAVKVLFASPFLSAEKAQQRFLVEINALRTLQHKAIVRYVMAGVSDDEHRAPFLIMEHIDGGTLRELSAELSVDDKIAAITDVLDALASLHARGIFHRDVKPSNVMRRASDGQTVLVDFGLAWLARDQFEGAPLSSGFVGTPGYAPPEAHEGDRTKSRDPRFDIYSAAVTLYELLASRLPIESQRYRPLREHDLDLAGLDPILQRALAPAAERYASAAEFAGDLTGWVRAYKARKASPKSPLLERLRAEALKRDAADEQAAKLKAERERKISEQLADIDAWVVSASKEACSEFVDAFRDVRVGLEYKDSERFSGQAGFDALCYVQNQATKSVIHFGRAEPDQVKSRLLGRGTEPFFRWPQRGKERDPRLENRPLAALCWVLWSSEEKLRGAFAAEITHSSQLRLHSRATTFAAATEPTLVTEPAQVKDYVTRVLSLFFLRV